MLLVGGDELVEVLGLVHGQVLVDEGIVVDVGVAVGDRRRAGPAHPGEADDRAVVRRPGGAGGGRRRAVGLLDLDGDGPAGHGLLTVVVLVGGRRPGHEVERVGGEAVAGRHGVGPGERVGESDADAGQPRELHAVDVALAGDGELHLPEAQLLLPREVGVGQQHPATRLGAVRAQSPPVRAQGRGRGVELERGAGGEAGAGGDGPRRLGLGDVGEELARRRLQGDRPGVGVDVEAGDRLHPRRPLAPAVDAVGPHLGQVRIPAGGEGVDQLADLGRLGRVVLGGPVVDPDGLPREVGVDVGVGVARAEPLGSLSLDLDDLIGQVTGAVLGAGIALPEREAAPVGRHDVGHPVGRAPDRGLEITVGHGGSVGRGGALRSARAPHQHHGRQRYGDDLARTSRPQRNPPRSN